MRPNLKLWRGGVGGVSRGCEITCEMAIASLLTARGQRCCRHCKVGEGTGLARIKRLLGLVRFRAALLRHPREVKLAEVRLQLPVERVRECLLLSAARLCLAKGMQREHFQQQQDLT